jgi:hypothetical protein
MFHRRDFAGGNPDIFDKPFPSSKEMRMTFIESLTEL